jgi:hypothetical protein
MVVVVVANTLRQRQREQTPRKPYENRNQMHHWKMDLQQQTVVVVLQVRQQGPGSVVRVVGLSLPGHVCDL